MKRNSTVAVLAIALTAACGPGGQEPPHIPDAAVSPVTASPVAATAESVQPTRAAQAPDPCGPRTPGDSLLPANRIVAFYGNPMSKRMGILGLLPPDSMLARLQRLAEEYARLDPCTPVITALHLVAVVAQPTPGADKLYRARTPDTVIERLAQWAERSGSLLFLDIQPGRSSIESEIRHLETYLKRPYVHLAIDPEFAMAEGQVPGRVIGSIDAEDVNLAVRELAKLVSEHGLPPKILVVHRFTQRMIRNIDRIRTDPPVQIVIDMDGFGPPPLKRDTWRACIASQVVQYTGFKLFYELDRPLMSPADVLALKPTPVFVLYQ